MRFRAAKILISPKVAVTSIAALAAAVVVSFWVGAQPVRVTVDFYPESPGSPIAMLTPQGEGHYRLASHVIHHERLPGRRLRVEATARVFERNALELMLDHRVADEEEPALQVRRHPGGGDTRTLVIETQLPENLVSGSVLVSLFAKDATQPIELFGVTATLSNPLGPPEEAAGEEIPLTDWKAPAEYVQPVSQPKTAGVAFTPELKWSGGAASLVKSDTAHELLPAFYEIEVTSLPFRRNREQAFEEWASHTYFEFSAPGDSARGDFSPEVTPPRAWIEPLWGEGRIIASSAPYASFVWRNWSEGPPVFRLLKHSNSGLAQVRTFGEPQLFDLYDEASTSYLTPAVVPRKRVQRFEATVPRRALRSLEIALPDSHPRSVYGLTIHTWLPQIQYAQSAPAKTHLLTWVSKLDDNAIGTTQIPLKTRVSWEEGGIWTALFVLVGIALAAATIWALTRCWTLLRRLSSAASEFIARARAKPPRKWRIPAARVARPVAVIAVIAAIAAIGLAIAFTKRIGDQPIPVGLDFAPGYQGNPVLWFTPPDREAVNLGPMARLPDDYSPQVTQFEIVATGTKSEESEGYGIYLTTLPAKDLLRHAEQKPPLSWDVSREFAYTLGGAGSTLSYEGFGGNTIVAFRRDIDGGRAIVRTRNGDLTVDTYAEERVFEPVVIPPNDNLVRFYSAVPRRYLAALAIDLAAPAIDFAEAPAAEIMRLYLGTAVPKIYFTGEIYPLSAWGDISREWKPALEGGRLTIPSFADWEQGGWRTFAAVSAGIFTAIFVLLLSTYSGFVVLLRMWFAPPIAPVALRPFSWKAFAVFSGLFLAVLGVYFASYYPGITVPDTESQWHQIETDTFADSHPLLHTLFLKGTRMIWDTWSGVSMIQVFVMAVVLAFGLSVLVRARVPWPFIGIALIAALISPRIGTQSVTIWKDTLYSAFVFALTILLALYVFDERMRSRLAMWGFLGVLLALISLWRHNGLAVLAFMTPALILNFRHQWMRATASIVLAWSIFLVMKLAVYPPLTASPGQRPGTDDLFANYNNMRYSRNFLAQDPPISPSTYKIFRDAHYLKADDSTLLYTTNSFASYNRDQFVLHLAATESGLGQPAAQELRTLLFGNPLVALRCAWFSDWIWRSDFLFGTTSDIRLGLYIPDGIQHAYLGSLSIKLRAYVRNLAVNARLVYSRPVIPFYLVLLAGVIWWARKRDVRALIVYAPAIVNSLAIVAVGAGLSDRYHFPLELAAGFLLCLPFAKIRPPEPDAETETANSDG